MRTMRLTALSVIAGMAALASQASGPTVRLDHEGDPIQFRYAGRQRTVAQWKRETGRGKRKGKA